MTIKVSIFDGKFDLTIENYILARFDEKLKADKVKGLLENGVILSDALAIVENNDKVTQQVPTDKLFESVNKLALEQLTTYNSEVAIELSKYAALYQDALNKGLINSGYHGDFNRLLDDKGLWDHFKNIRTKNLHENRVKEVNGIGGPYFKIMKKLFNWNSFGKNKIVTQTKW